METQDAQSKLEAGILFLPEDKVNSEERTSRRLTTRIASSHDPVNEPKRDWSSAIDLVSEACEAVKLAEERANTAERYSQQLNMYFAEQVKSLEAKLAAAESRLVAAQMRATEEEEWLQRYHQAIIVGFKGVLDENHK